MSGEGLGLIFVAPLVIGAVMVAGGALIAGGAIYGVIRLGIAAANYALERHESRERRSQTPAYRRVSKPVAASYKPVASTTGAAEFNAGKAMGNAAATTYNNVTTKEEKRYQFNSNVDLDGLSSELESIVSKSQNAFENRLNEEARAMQEEMNALDHESLAEYINNLGHERADAMAKIRDSFEAVKKETVDATAKLLDTYRIESSKATDDARAAIDEFVKGREDKEIAQKEICKQYIDDIEQLISDVKELFSKATENEIFNKLIENYESAVEHFNKGNYESCIAIVVTLKGLIGEQVYELERKEHEKDALYQMALTLTEQTKNFLESQKGFNADTVELLREQGINVSLPEELMGIEYVHYADRDKNGNNKLLQIINDVNAVYEKLTTSNPDDISEETLQVIIDKIGKEKYPQAYREVNACMENIANAYFRVGRVGEFMEFLEDKGLYVDYVKTEEADADGIVDATTPITVTAYNKGLNEKVAYTFGKNGSVSRDMEEEDIFTENGYKTVEIKYDCFSAENLTEERNKYYQGLIDEFSGVKISCKSGTEGKVSDNISDKVAKVLDQMQ